MQAFDTREEGTVNRPRNPSDSGGPEESNGFARSRQSKGSRKILRSKRGCNNGCRKSLANRRKSVPSKPRHDQGRILTPEAKAI
jgi:hypothetical protein